MLKICALLLRSNQAPIALLLSGVQLACSPLDRGVHRRLHLTARQLLMGSWPRCNSAFLMLKLVTKTGKFAPIWASPAVFAGPSWESPQGPPSAAAPPRTGWLGCAKSWRKSRPWPQPCGVDSLSGEAGVVKAPGNGDVGRCAARRMFVLSLVNARCQGAGGAPTDNLCDSGNWGLLCGVYLRWRVAQWPLA